MTIRTIRGVRTHVEDLGSGPALILVHGFLVSGREWDDVAPLLAKRFRVIVPDLPGFGRSDKPHDFPYGRPGFCDHLRALQDELGLERAHVMGHSMGGAIACELAARVPERIDRLVVMSGACYPFDLPLKGKLPFVPVIGRVMWKHLYSRALFRDYFRNDVWGGKGPPTWDRVDRYFQDFDSREGRAASLKVLPHTVDFSGLGAMLPRIRAKTLVVWGEHDPLIPLRLGERCSRDIPGAELEVMAGVGHAPNEERPAELAEIVTRFLS